MWPLILVPKDWLVSPTIDEVKDHCDKMIEEGHVPPTGLLVPAPLYDTDSRKRINSNGDNRSHKGAVSAASCQLDKKKRIGCKVCGKQLRPGTRTHKIYGKACEAWRLNSKTNGRSSDSSNIETRAEEEEEEEEEEDKKKKKEEEEEKEKEKEIDETVVTKSFSMLIISPIKMRMRSTKLPKVLLKPLLYAPFPDHSDADKRRIALMKLKVK